jgi:hypothetical protein
MTNKELQEELKKHPDDSLMLTETDYGEFPTQRVMFSEDLPKNAIRLNMTNPERKNYIVVR